MHRYMRSDSQPLGLRSVLIIAIVAFSLLWALSDDADAAPLAAGSVTSLCGSSVVRDYEAPFMYSLRPIRFRSSFRSRPLGSKLGSCARQERTSSTKAPWRDSD